MRPGLTKLLPGLDESYLDDDENDPELAEAVKQSTNAYYGNQLEGEASGSTAHNYYHSVEEFGKVTQVLTEFEEFISLILYVICR